jgi:general secretion pathway protein K
MTRPSSKLLTPRPRTKRLAPSRKARARKREGIALLIAMGAIAILTIMVADLHETTGTGYAVASSKRDGLRAEMLAQSGLDLTRLLVSQEPAIRRALAPLLQNIPIGGLPPQLPVWSIANSVLAPFCNYEGVEEGSSIGLSSSQGLGDLPGRCEIVAVAENSKINLGDPLHFSDDSARRVVSMQVFALMGGYQSPSPYDSLFQRIDAEGQFSTRLDIVSSMVDWWDADNQRTNFDPGANTVGSSGSEDNIYARYDDRYTIKNAPFDSVEEIRLVRGVTDDYWATFVEPDADDPRSRIVTIYGSGRINPNDAPPAALIARVCSFEAFSQQPLCTDPLERQKFDYLLTTIRQMVPLPLFQNEEGFILFIEGSSAANSLFGVLKSMLGENNPLLFRPLTIPADKRSELRGAFITVARLLTIQATGTAGRARTRIRAVVNFDTDWHPPPPNAGRMPVLGIFHHYRID